MSQFWPDFLNQVVINLVLVLLFPLIYIFVSIFEPGRYCLRGNEIHCGGKSVRKNTKKNYLENNLKNIYKKLAPWYIYYIFTLFTHTHNHTHRHTHTLEESYARSLKGYKFNCTSSPSPVPPKKQGYSYLVWQHYLSIRFSVIKLLSLIGFPFWSVIKLNQIKRKSRNRGNVLSCTLSTYATNAG